MTPGDVGEMVGDDRRGVSVERFAFRYREGTVSGRRKVGGSLPMVR